MTKIIYSKKYSGNNFVKAPKEINFEKLDKGFLAFAKSKNKNMVANMSYEEVPGRREGLRDLINMAKDICDDYRYDLVIRQLPYGIMLEVSLDFTQYTDGNLNRLIGMTNDMKIEPGKKRDVTFCLHYDVIRIYLDGELVFPEISGL